MGQRDWVQGSVLWVHRRGSPQGRQDLSLPASIPPAGGLGEAGCGLPRKRIPPNGKLKAQAGSQPFAPSPHTQVAPAPTHNLGFYCADRGTLLQDEVVFFVVAFRRVLFFPPLTEFGLRQAVETTTNGHQKMRLETHPHSAGWALRLPQRSPASPGSWAQPDLSYTRLQQH